MLTILKLFSPNESDSSQAVSKTVPDVRMTAVIRCVIDITAGSWNRHMDRCGDNGRGRDIITYFLFISIYFIGIRQHLGRINESGIDSVNVSMI